MEMNRSYIRDLITAKLSHWGSPYSYKCYLNGKRLRSVKELKREAEPGDEVKVNVCKNWALCHRVLFKIKRDDNTVASYRENYSHKLWNRPDDYQRSRLYSWESRFEFFDLREEKFEDADEAEGFLRNELLDDYDTIEVPEVKSHPNRTRWSIYRSTSHQIRLSTDQGHSKQTVIHEAAHAVVEESGVQHLVSFHGPVFVRVFIELLEPYTEESVEEMVEDARNSGLDVAKLSISDLEKIDGEVSVDMLAKLRRETYHTEKGQELTETQLKAIRQFRNGERVDRRGGDALARRGILLKTEDSYETGPNWDKLIV